jgi:hypothetical protein
MITRSLLFAALFAVSTAFLPAQDQLPALHGRCSLAPAADPGHVRFELEEGCQGDRAGCNDHDSDNLLLSNFTGITLDDLQHEGAHLDAVLAAEAGKLTCSGVVHDLTLQGDSTFVPNPGFVAQMGRMGFTGFDSQKLEACTLFHIETAWVASLQSAGVADLDSNNILALRIFRVDAAYVHDMDALGYPRLPASQLIAFKVQGVNPDEVRQYRALGYQPDAGQLIQMRIFKVTPDFIRRMQGRGLGDLTISKLVQIRIFNLAD